jgi:hypothetical protein
LLCPLLQDKRFWEGKLALLQAELDSKSDTLLADRRYGSRHGSHIHT